MDAESRSGWTLGLSLVEVMLLLVFAVLLVYVTDNVEGKGEERRSRKTAQRYDAVSE